jgi:hypothetical protein
MRGFEMMFALRFCSSSWSCASTSPSLEDAVGDRVAGRDRRVVLDRQPGCVVVGLQRPAGSAVASKNVGSRRPTFHSMPMSRSASASTSTSLAVISICGVVESSVDRHLLDRSRLLGRSLTISEFVRFSTWIAPRA